MAAGCQEAQDAEEYVLLDEVPRPRRTLLWCSLLSGTAAALGLYAGCRGQAPAGPPMLQSRPERLPDCAAAGAAEAWGAVLPQEILSDRTRCSISSAGLCWSVANAASPGNGSLGTWLRPATLDSLGSLLMTRYLFVAERAGAPQALLQAREVWGHHMGKRYMISRCPPVDEDQEAYAIFGTSGFLTTWAFTITSSHTGEVIGRAEALRGADSRHVIVRGADDAVIANMTSLQGKVQGSQAWPPSWHAINIRPDLLPNEVLSLLVVVYSDMHQWKLPSRWHRWLPSAATGT